MIGALNMESIRKIEFQFDCIADAISEAFQADTTGLKVVEAGNIYMMLQRLSKRVEADRKWLGLLDSALENK